MSKTVGERIVLSAIICLVGLGIVFIHVQTGSTSSTREVPEVRMSVDPTVLPLVQPPGAPVEENQPVEAMSDAEESETAETAVEIVPEVAPVPPVPEAKSEQKAKPKPLPIPVAKAGKGAVTGLKLDTTPTGFYITVTCDRAVGDTSYMNLSNPERLVIDLRQPWTLKARNVVRAADGPVKHIVVGAHPDRLRFVIHFRTPPKIKLVPQFVREGNRLIVRVDLS